MSFVFFYPPLLDQADSARIRFTLELHSSCCLPPFALLALRQRLLRCGRELLGSEAERLFAPPLSSDPVALRRFQKSAPAFVLCPQLLKRESWDAGDTLDLEVLFLGGGVQQIATHLRLFQELGRRGLLFGEGRFEVAAAACRTAVGCWRPLPLGAQGELAPPDVVSLGTYLDASLPLPPLVSLKVVTPARLVAAGRALRRPQFVQLFPFMLRRVSSMLYYHCHLEPLGDPGLLLAAANRVEAIWQASRWVDWRELGEGGESGKVGGVIGNLQLNGPGMEELGWVIALATLFGIGRGAAFGSGQLQLDHGVP